MSDDLKQYGYICDGYVCAGCGRFTKDYQHDFSPALSCCPERKPIAIYRTPAESVTADKSAEPVQETCPVDVEALKKKGIVRRAYDDLTMYGQEMHGNGWNECIDHLASEGYLQSGDNSEALEFPKYTASDHEIAQWFKQNEVLIRKALASNLDCGDVTSQTKRGG